MTTSWSLRAVDGAVVALLVAIGAWGFAPVFAGGAWFLAAAGALALGSAIGAASALWRWPLLTTAVAVMLAYLLTGGPLVLRSTTTAAVFPTAATIRGLAVGAVGGWKDLLTVEVPSEGLETVVLVPFLVVLVCAASAVAFATRLRGAGWALLPPTAVLVVAILFGTYHAVAPVAQATAFAVIAIAWLAWRRERDRSARAATPEPARGLRRVAFAASMLVIATGAGAAWSIAAAPGGQRAVLRDNVVPPLELHDYPSPLQSFRSYVRDDKDTTLFTIDGAPAGARIRLATLDAYNGVVYAVSGDGTGVAGSFERVGSVIPVNVQGKTAEVNVTVGGLAGVWVPTVGAVRSVDFVGPDADALSRSLHYNRATGTAVVTSGLTEGDSYTMDVVVPAVPSDTELADAAFAALAPARVTHVPEGLLGLATDALGDEASPHGEVAALATYLSASGYFSHGLEGQAPSRSGHGEERIAALLGADQMVGDDEQYAVAFALMAHELGIPARVVMGFEAPEGASGPIAVTGDDLHAWAEVAYDGYGWVAVDPTPAKDRAPLDQEIPPQREPKPQVMQPPAAPEEPPAVPPAVPFDDEAVAPPDDVLAQALRVAVYVAAGLGILLLLAGPGLGILIAKARRRRGRRRLRDLAARVAAGWSEVTDAAADYGVEAPLTGTRVERADAIDAALEGACTRDLALAADRLVWGPGDVDAASADSYWASVTETVTGLHRAHGLRRRVVARFSARSLVAGRRSTRSKKGRKR
jgi:transglutaminase-like putative cysteine protease